MLFPENTGVIDLNDSLDPEEFRTLAENIDYHYYSVLRHKDQELRVAVLPEFERNMADLKRITASQKLKATFTKIFRIYFSSDLVEKMDRQYQAAVLTLQLMRKNAVYCRTY